MAANINPIFIKTPRVEQAKLTTGSATYDGSAATQLFVAGADGSRIDKLRVMPLANVLSSKMLVYMKVGSVFTLYQDWPLTALTVSSTSTVGNINITINENVPAGAEIWVQLTVSGAWDVTCYGGDY